MIIKSITVIFTRTSEAYPVNDEKNGALYAEYKKLADAEPDVIFGGRLGEYKYYDMDKVIESALACVAVQMDKINQYKA